MLLQKKQRNVCYNFFESLYSFAHFKCKGYILYSKLLLQWAVEKLKLKKLYLEIFKYHIKKKKIRVDYFRSEKAKKCFVEKKILTVNLPWNDPYTFHVNPLAHVDALSSITFYSTPYYFLCNAYYYLLWVN